jgi:hypothetical protein
VRPQGPEALAAGGGEAKRAFEAMMSMKKIDVAAIKAARRLMLLCWPDAESAALTRPQKRRWRYTAWKKPNQVPQNVWHTRSCG